MEHTLAHVAPGSAFGAEVSLILATFALHMKGPQSPYRSIAYDIIVDMQHPMDCSCTCLHTILTILIVVSVSQSFSYIVMIAELQC